MTKENLAVAHKGRHADHTARAGFARPLCELGPGRDIANSRQGIGRRLRLRQASCQHGGVADVLLLLPERVEHGMDEIRALVACELCRETERRNRIGARRPGRA
jgi:hypothetical protein